MWSSIALELWRKLCARLGPSLKQKSAACGESGFTAKVGHDLLQDLSKAIRYRESRHNSSAFAQLLLKRCKYLQYVWSCVK